ncbi:hypothetical protein WG66_013631 [Moniliophthora roreri]|nr:hypothetical protein WG66_013631 [Moniliophthora roreri]
MSLYDFLSSDVPSFDRPPTNVSPPAERKEGTTKIWAGDSGLSNVFLKTLKEDFPNKKLLAFQDLIQEDTTVHEHLVGFEKNDLYQKLPPIFHVEAQYLYYTKLGTLGTLVIVLLAYVINYGTYKSSIKASMYVATFLSSIYIDYSAHRNSTTLKVITSSRTNGDDLSAFYAIKSVSA